MAALLALPVLRHALGTMTAALLALWLAYQLELDTPYSAATTVLIVSSPVQGMILSKSLYRLAGTLVGALAAVALMALFGQAPELFMLAFSLWMGLCTALSTLLHNFRSYAAVLAGYTVVLVAMPGVDHPELHIRSGHGAHRRGVPGDCLLRGCGLVARAALGGARSGATPARCPDWALRQLSGRCVQRRR